MNWKRYKRQATHLFYVNSGIIWMFHAMVKTTRFRNNNKGNSMTLDSYM